MAAALGPDGRPPSPEQRRLFSQHAFNAFGAANSKSIGASTRDQPYGSVSSGDRAKLAWNRTAPRQQAAFASDFLSEWLGAGSGTVAETSAGGGSPAAPGRNRVSGVRVPLAVDAQVRVPFGPMLVPLRALVLLTAATPLALVVHELGRALGRVAARACDCGDDARDSRSLLRCVMGSGWALGSCIDLSGRVMTTAVLDGQGCRASVKCTGDAMQVSRIRRETRVAEATSTRSGISPRSRPSAVRTRGLIRLNPGGARGILVIEGPGGSPTSEVARPLVLNADAVAPRSGVSSATGQRREQLRQSSCADRL